jgi:hypothetical protein
VAWRRAEFFEVESALDVRTRVIRRIEMCGGKLHIVVFVNEGAKPGVMLYGTTPAFGKKGTRLLGTAVARREGQQFMFILRHCHGEVIAEVFDGSRNAVVVCGKWPRLVLASDKVVKDSVRKVPVAAPSQFCIELANAGIMAPASRVSEVGRHVTGAVVRGQGLLKGETWGSLMPVSAGYLRNGGLVFHRRCPTPGFMVTVDRTACELPRARQLGDPWSALYSFAQAVIAVKALCPERGRKCLEQVLCARQGRAVCEEEWPAPATYAVFHEHFPFSRENEWQMGAVYGIVSVARIGDADAVRVLRSVLK